MTDAFLHIKLKQLYKCKLHQVNDYFWGGIPLQKIIGEAVAPPASFSAFPSIKYVTVSEKTLHVWMQILIYFLKFEMS